MPRTLDFTWFPRPMARFATIPAQGSLKMASTSIPFGTPPSRGTTARGTT